jgi:phosphoglycolate phosphatase-like HAD superfamily hydrolase
MIATMPHQTRTRCDAKVVIFDRDGVLVDSDRISLRIRVPGPPRRQASRDQAL